jgi:GDP-L-fucose synthase
MRILRTGKNGLVGKAIQRLCTQFPQHEFIFIGRQDYDLRKEEDVNAIFHKHNPVEAIIHCAASVGGYEANNTKPAEFFRDNILMNTHLIQFAYQYNVTRFLGFSSVCALDDTKLPLTEDNLHSGPPHPIHEAYAYSKRMIDVQIRAYKKQWGKRNYSSLILTNVLGTEDNYDTSLGHIVPSLIHKLYRAKHFDEPFVVWGTGEAEREFIDADDVAEAAINLCMIRDVPERMILSSGRNYKIKDVVRILCEAADYPYKNVCWDLSKPNGQLSRPTNTSVFQRTLPHLYDRLIPLGYSLERTYKWFSEHYPNCRGVEVNE